LNNYPNIIAISGCPGGGKTSLCQALSRHYSVCGDLSTGQLLVEQPSLDESALSIIYYDHFQQVTEQSIETLSKWSEEGGDYDDLKLPLLERALSEIRSGRGVVDPVSGLDISPTKTVFFETPLGRDHSKTAQYIDTLIWIDTPLDVALARNITDIISRFAESVRLSDSNKIQTLDFLDWQKGYVSHYLSTVRELLVSQREKSIAQADIILDGTQSMDKVFEQAVALLGELS